MKFEKIALPALGLAAGLMCAFIFLHAHRERRLAMPPIARHTHIAAAKPLTSPRTEALPPPAVAVEGVAQRLIDSLRSASGRKDVRPNETVLSFKDDAAYARFLSRAAQAGLTVLGRIDGLRAVRVRYTDFNALAAEIAGNSADYADASGNLLVNVPQAPAKDNRAPVNEVPFGNGALAFIGATGDRSQWGRGVTVAVIDTGIAANDATFGAGRVNALDIGFGVAPGHASDDGHGTSVASLVGGTAPDAPGVAPAANLLSIRVTDANSTSDIFTIAQAIVAAVDAGARVLNVSLGGYGTTGALEAAIGYANDHGAVIVAAAGNDQASQLAWPAADPRVISVGAVDQAGQQVSFSNSGPQLQLTAPGYGVQTAWLDGQRAYVDGTSASAPLVSGAIAALLSQYPNLTAAQAAQILTSTADDAGAPGHDAAYGNGILDVGWAMNANNPAYVDTAVASHYYDAASNQMVFVVQNRSGHAIAGLTLDVAAGTTTSNYLIGNLAPGATQSIRVPVNSGQLTGSGQIQYTTTLNNPADVVDQVPANNRRSSVLTLPKTGK
jgi:subtilisin family serine protease